MRRLTNEEFLQRVKEIGEGEFTILNDYINQRTKVKVRHSCGHEWESLGNTLMRKPGCPICSGNEKKTTEQYKEQIKGLVGNEYQVLSEYTSNKNKITFLHNDCSTTFAMEAKAFLLGQRCPECKKKNLSKRFSKTHEMFTTEVFDRVGDEFEVLGKYQRKDRPIKMKHVVCQTIFEVTPNHFLSSMESRCPYCKSSKGEKAIESFLVNNSIEYIHQFRIKECKNKRSLPFDFAILEKGKLKLLIEFDGIQHYYPKWGQKEFERTIKNDEIKDNYCKQNKIPLIRIPYTLMDIESELAKILL
jgi:hypothetical protein